VVDLTAVAFGGATGAAVAHGEQGSELVSLRRWRAVVDEALGSDLGTDPLRDHPGDLDHPSPLVQVRFHPITGGDGGRRLGRLPVDLDVTTPDRAGCVRARLGQTDGMEPLVDADGVDAPTVAAEVPYSRRMSRRNMVWLAAILIAGVTVGAAAGWLPGVAAAVAVLVVSEVVERVLRRRRSRTHGTEVPSVRAAVKRKR
jgi:hypothetical protein